jgi:hypothetical protein
LAIGVLIVSLLYARPVEQLAQQARFIRFTNGFVGPFAAIYSAASTNSAQIVQRWLASGTNIVVLNATNQQSYRIILYPYVGFHKTNGIQAHYQTFLLNAPTSYGIFLEPGEGTMIEVAVLPGAGPGRVRLGYTADYYHSFSRMQAELAGLIQGKKHVFLNEWFYSDWFHR